MRVAGRPWSAHPRSLDGDWSRRPPSDPGRGAVPESASRRGPLASLERPWARGDLQGPGEAGGGSGRRNRLARPASCPRFVFVIPPNSQQPESRSAVRPSQLGASRLWRAHRPRPALTSGGAAVGAGPVFWTVTRTGNLLTWAAPCPRPGSERHRSLVPS
ncbi:hypothetical protein VULLAG_LOCUS23187 [Vulpes lagopus]